MHTHRAYTVKSKETVMMERYTGPALMVLSLFAIADAAMLKGKLFKYLFHLCKTDTSIAFKMHDLV